MKTWIRRQLPLLLVWTNSYERLTWTPILVLIAHELDAPHALAFAASAYSAANLVGNIVLGAASDRLGALPGRGRIPRIFGSDYASPPGGVVRGDLDLGQGGARVFRRRGDAYVAFRSEPKGQSRLSGAASWRGSGW